MANKKRLTPQQVFGRLSIAVTGQSIVDVLPAIMSLLNQLVDSALRHPSTAIYLRENLKAMLTKVDGLA